MSGPHTLNEFNQILSCEMQKKFNRVSFKVWTKRKN